MPSVHPHLNLLVSMLKAPVRLRTAHGYVDITDAPVDADGDGTGYLVSWPGQAGEPRHFDRLPRAWTEALERLYALQAAATILPKA